MSTYSLAEPSRYRGDKICLGVSPVVSWFSEECTMEAELEINKVRQDQTEVLDEPVWFGRERERSDQSCGMSHEFGSCNNSEDLLSSSGKSDRRVSIENITSLVPETSCLRPRS